MSDTDLQPARSRGVYWRHFSTGDPIGGPLSEWAYITPEHPDGITGSSLRFAGEETQLDTARFWFLSNFAPYRLPPGTYFGFTSEPTNSVPSSLDVASGFTPNLDMSFGGGSATRNPLSGSSGFGGDEAGDGGVHIGGYGSPFAPSPLSAEQMLRHQFGDALSDEVHSQLAEELGDNWIERDRLEPRRLSEDTVAGSSVADAQAKIFATLDAIIEQVAALTEPPIGMGHNGPPDGPPMVTIDRATFLELVDRARAGAASGDARGATELTEATHSLKDLSRKFASGALKLAGVFVTKAVESAGTAAGKWVIGSIAASGTLMLLIDQLAKNADQLSKLVH